MRAIAFFFGILFATLPGAVAGLVIVQEADQFGPMPGKTTLTMKIAGESARVDIGDQLSSIVDLASGKTTSLLHAQKAVMQIPAGALEALTQKAAGGGKPDLKATGEKKTISGYACAEYTGTFQGLGVTYWVTQDVPHQKEILAQMGRFAKGGDPFKAALSGGADFPGFPIRTIVKSPQHGDMTMTVLSIKEAEIPAAEFVVPADYHSMAMPPLPGAPEAATPPAPPGN